MVSSRSQMCSRAKNWIGWMRALLMMGWFWPPRKIQIVIMVVTHFIKSNNDKLQHECCNNCHGKGIAIRRVYEIGFSAWPTC